MGHKADLRRRWMGAVFLGTALLMLIAGETVLKHRMRAVPLLIYYLVLILFLGLAIFVALLDLAVVRFRAREEQRALLEDALKDIAREKEVRSGKTPPKDNGH
jgi:heme exporter protein D